MKVQKQNKKKVDFKLKDVRVKLTKLTEQQKLNLLNNPTGKKRETFNLTFKLNANKWSIANCPNDILTVIGGNNILISHRTGQHIVNMGKKADPTKSTSSSSAQYQLRRRPQIATVPVQSRKAIPCTAVSELGVNVRKASMWTACKKKADKSKIIEKAFVFAKQNGYAPWPSEIQSINKSKTSAMVKYFGFENYKGVVKINEIVQVDGSTMDDIGHLVKFILQTKSIKEFQRFTKAMNEVQGAMQF